MISSKKIPVILDTDPGVDDIIALLFALSSPELEILAIIVSYGNTDIESAYANVLKTYQAVQRHLDLYPADALRFPNFFNSLKTILCRGSDGPLEGALHSATYFHGRDGLGEISSHHPELNVVSNPQQLVYPDQHGIEVILDVLREHEERSITYIAIGPLTNLARLMHRDSKSVSSKIGLVICMGGALDVPGNTSAVAEFNFFADPFAARNLLGPKAPYEFPLPLDRFLLLPLDTTSVHQIPFTVYREQVDPCFESSTSSEKPLTNFTSAFLTHTRRIMNKFGIDAMELHDIVAVWCAINYPSFSNGSSMKETAVPGWKAVKRLFDIERTGELTRGMVVVDRREDDSAYAPGANRAEVQAALDEVNFSVHKKLESIALPARVEVEFDPSNEKADDKPQGVVYLADTWSRHAVEASSGEGLGMSINRAR
ncbi:hypothetical protein GYMLUDRAFT_34898 [Collybiopsis luxurians FD-317 M1]|nr:hypothetical protein GYMLUDRAFT_34898 [Collybiopsis luxurians FD-317 M1]